MVQEDLGATEVERAGGKNGKERKKNQSREGEQDWSKVGGVAVENRKMVNHWWKELNESNQGVRLLFTTQLKTFKASK